MATDIETWDDGDLVFPGDEDVAHVLCPESDTSESEFFRPPSSIGNDYMNEDDNNDFNDKSNTIKARQQDVYSTLRKMGTLTPSTNKNHHHHNYQNENDDFVESLEKFDITPKQSSKTQQKQKQQQRLPKLAQKQEHQHRQQTTTTTTKYNTLTPSSVTSPNVVTSSPMDLGGNNNDNDDLFDDLVLPPFLGGPGVATPPSSIHSGNTSTPPSSSKPDLQQILEDKLQKRSKPPRKSSAMSIRKETRNTTTPTTAKESRKYLGLPQSGQRNPSSGSDKGVSNLNNLTPSDKTPSSTSKIRSTTTNATNATTTTTTPSSKPKRGHKHQLSSGDPFGRASLALGKPLTPTSSPKIGQKSYFTNQSNAQEHYYHDHDRDHAREHERLPKNYGALTNNTDKKLPSKTTPTASVSSNHHHRRTSSRTLGKVKRIRHHGDGTELDDLDDLPVDKDKEAKFIKVARRLPSGSIATVRASSDGTKRITEYSSNKNSSSKKPQLIQDLTSTGLAKIPGDMAWNQEKERWEGAETSSSQQSGHRRVISMSSKRPALITNMASAHAITNPNTKSSSARIVGKMVFDPQKMCWHNKDPQDEEELLIDNSEIDGHDFNYARSTESSSSSHLTAPDAWTGGEQGRLKKKASFFSLSGNKSPPPPTTPISSAISLSSPSSSFQDDAFYTTSSKPSTISENTHTHTITTTTNDNNDDNIPQMLGWGSQGNAFWQECKSAQHRHAQEMKPWKQVPNTSEDKSYLWNIRRIVMDH